MAISEHLDKFAGFPVREFNPEAGIADTVTTIYQIAHDPESSSKHSHKAPGLLARPFRIPKKINILTLITDCLREHVPYFRGNPVPYVPVSGTGTTKPLSTYALNRAYKANGNRFNRNSSRVTALASVGVEAAGKTTVGPIADYPRHALAGTFFQTDSTDLDSVKNLTPGKDSPARWG
jgi:hypothetical protein